MVQPYLHMDESGKHYTAEVTKARKMKLDLVLSERSIVSPLIFTDTYFRHDIFSAFTKDSINMMWGDETGNDADLVAVKPDTIIFLKVPLHVVRSWLKKESGNSSRSEAERQYLTKGNYSSFLDHHHDACWRFMDMTDIPHHEVELDKNVTPREAVLGVYIILMAGIGADGGLGTPISISDELFPSDEETE